MNKDFNLNQLRVFHHVATLLSFTRAAEKLHLTQPGISKHIGALEAHYGNQLFDRLGKKVVMTQAGEILLEAVTKMFQILDEASMRINDLKGLAGGRLNIGASIMIGTYLLPGVLAKFKQRHPAVDIAIDISLSEQIENKVLNNALEVGLIGHHASDSRLVVRRLKTDKMVLIVSAGHGWAKRKSPVGLRELTDQPFLLPQQGSGTRKILEGLFQQSGIRPKQTMELGNTEGVKKAVEAGLGISIISDHIVQSELADGRIKSLKVKGADLRRNLYAVYRKDKYLSAATQAFLKHLDLDK
jgi:DNA-binding transcriptional LysR family regulator